MSLSSLIWSVAELLRGDYKQHDYGEDDRTVHRHWTGIMKIKMGE